MFGVKTPFMADSNFLIDKYIGGSGQRLWSKPLNATMHYILISGAGGGGGNGTATSGGGGGGSGHSGKFLVPSVLTPDMMEIILGAGGAAQTNGGASGISMPNGFALYSAPGGLGSTSTAGGGGGSSGSGRWSSHFAVNLSQNGVTGGAGGGAGTGGTDASVTYGGNGPGAGGGGNAAGGARGGDCVGPITTGVNPYFRRVFGGHTTTRGSKPGDGYYIFDKNFFVSMGGGGCGGEPPANNITGGRGGPGSGGGGGGGGTNFSSGGAGGDGYCIIWSV